MCGSTPPGTLRTMSDSATPKTTHRLRLDWVQRGSPASAVTVYDDYATLMSADGRRTTSAGLLAEIPAAGYALVLTDTAEYFRE